MRLTVRLFPLVLVLHMVTNHGVAKAQAATKPKPNSVQLSITTASSKDAVIHWKVTNNNDLAVYVYDFFLWGPALSVEQSPDRTVFNTTPLTEQATCPPNRVAPVLLLVVAPGRTITGELQDERLKDLRGKGVALRVAVGLDPYSVVDETKRFFNSDCKHSPYDAIVRWGAIIESDAVKVEQ
jgi:hypothetical protein